MCFAHLLAFGSFIHGTVAVAAAVWYPSDESMSDNESVIPLLVIAGPTASGKTEAALRVAEALGGEIVSSDSMQIYRDLDVGTAKPTANERARAPFHLVDFVHPRAEYSVVEFQRDAREAIRDIHARGRLPILSGGTGLYLRAVLGNLDFPPGPEDKQVRDELADESERVGPQIMHERLAQIDPEAAASILPGDTRRIIRALEVHRLTGRPISQLASVDRSPELQYNAAQYVLAAPRQMLLRRIDSRVDAMMAAGWLDEVKTLRDCGVTAEHQCMQAIGYRHLMAHLDGREPGDLDEMVGLIKRDTRRYAKRQLTWLRADEGFVWLAPGSDSQRAAALAIMLAGARRITN
jgi:tRNA dimethylallyltransferase